MTIVLDRPRVQEAPDIVERPVRCGEEETDNDKEYLFYEDDIIVYRTSADCYVCAWKDGHPRFPRALMAVAMQTSPSLMLSPPCRCKQLHRLSEYIFFEGDSIVGRLRDYCGLRAWKEGHPRWPVAELAINVPMKEVDIHLPCEA